MAGGRRRAQRGRREAAAEANGETLVDEPMLSEVLSQQPDALAWLEARFDENPNRTDYAKVRDVFPWKQTNADGSITDEPGWRKTNKKIVPGEDGVGVEVEYRNKDISNWFDTRKKQAARVAEAAAKAAAKAVEAPEKSAKRRKTKR